jgi:hypothetical protein
MWEEFIYKCLRFLNRFGGQAKILIEEHNPRSVIVDVESFVIRYKFAFHFDFPFFIKFSRFASVSRDTLSGVSAANRAVIIGRGVIFDTMNEAAPMY